MELLLENSRHQIGLDIITREFLLMKTPLLAIKIFNLISK